MADVPGTVYWVVADGVRQPETYSDWGDALDAVIVCLQAGRTDPHVCYQRPKRIRWKRIPLPMVREPKRPKPPPLRIVPQPAEEEVIEYPPAPLPVVATDAEPGSEEKVQLMEERARDRVQLFHPDDNGVVGPPSDAGYRPHRQRIPRFRIVL